MNEYLLNQDVNFLTQINKLDFRKKENKKLFKLTGIKNKKELIISVNDVLAKKNISVSTKNKQNANAITDTDTETNTTISTNKNTKIDIKKNSNIIKHDSKIINATIKIQKFIKQYLTQYLIYKYGCAWNNRKISTNDCDFYTFDKIVDIPLKYFISYEDNNFIYSFDICSLQCLFNMGQYLNPYNRCPIPEHIIKMVEMRMDVFYKKQQSIKENEKLLNKKKENPEFLTKRRTTSIFQIMDELDQYTDVNWFNDFTLYELKKYYSLLEDIWNYRAQLSPESKRKIVKNADIFQIRTTEMQFKRSINEVRNIILDQIEKLITEGETRDDRVLGCMYVLSAFVKLSKNAQESLPWLL